MKKIFAKLILVFLAFNIFNLQVFALDETNYFKGMAQNRLILEQDTIYGQKYLKLSNDFIANLNSPEQLKLMVLKTEELIKSGKIKDNFKVALLSYLHYSAKAKLQRYPEEEIKNTISEEDKNFAKEKILEIQKIIYDSAFENFEQILNNLKKELNSKSNSNLKLELDAYDDENSIKGNLNFKNVESKQANFDSEIKADISGGIEIKNEILEINTNFSTIFENISKNGEAYLALKNLEIKTLPEVEEIKNFIEIFKKKVGNNYIKISNEDSKEAYEILNNFINLNNNEFIDFKKYLSTFTEKPLFEAYKKEENKYFLQPTKNICFNKCSDKEFKSMLKDFNDNVELYLIFENNEYKIYFNLKNNYVNGGGFLNFDKNSIKEVSIKIEAPRNLREKDYLNLVYKKFDKLDITGNGKDFNFAFLGKLNSKNNFERIVSKLSSEDIKLDFSFENNNIKGNYEYKGWLEEKVNIDFDLKLDEYIPVSGNLNLIYISSGGNEALKINLNGKNGNFTGKTEINDAGLNLLANHNWNISKNSIKINDTFEAFNEILGQKLKVLNGKLNTNIFSQNNFSKFNLDFSITKLPNQNFNLKMDFDNKTDYVNNIKISAPKNFVNLEEIFDLSEYYFDTYNF